MQEPRAGSGDGQPALIAPDERTSTGLEPRLAAVLAYLLGILSAILLLVIEKKSRFVRFHAMQSLLTFGGLLIIQLVLQVIPLLGQLLSFAVGVIGVVLWLHLMYRAWQGQFYKLPYVGDRAAEQVKA